MENGDAPVVDVVFALGGMSAPGRPKREYRSAQHEGGPICLPAEHALDLWRATVARLPWLADDPRTGIHPLRTSPAPGGEALLARRAKLVLRIPRERAAAADALAGHALDVAGRRLDVGAGEARPLRAWGTLHAQRVALGEADAARFEAALGGVLDALDVRCEFITGRRRTQGAGGEEVVGFSVALVGLAPAASLRVQCEGLGGERRLGWGIFVPHKSIAAVV